MKTCVRIAGFIGVVASLLGTVFGMLALVENMFPLWTLLYVIIGGTCAMLCCVIVFLNVKDSE